MIFQRSYFVKGGSGVTTCGKDSWEFYKQRSEKKENQIQLMVDTQEERSKVCQISSDKKSGVKEAMTGVDDSAEGWGV